MFNTKKIKELEAEIKTLEKYVYKVDSKLEEITIEIQGEKEDFVGGWYCDYRYDEYTFIFLKGQEPKCDSIREDKKGNRTYFKKDVACDIKGNLLLTKDK